MIMPQIRRKGLSRQTISLPVIQAKTEGPFVGNRECFCLKLKNLKIFFPCGKISQVLNVEMAEVLTTVNYSKMPLKSEFQIILHVTCPWIGSFLQD